MPTQMRSAVVLAALAFLAACGGSDSVSPGGVISCTQDPTQAKCIVVVDVDSTLRLKAAKTSRYVGNAAGSKFGTAAYNALFLKEFSMLTPENALKMDAVHPARATFNYTTPDAMLAFTVANGMKMRGHTLVWHSQVPAWLTNGGFSADTLLKVMTDHITTIMTHYKGQIYAWDVVNEALNDNGSQRASVWSNTLGPTYIEQAFKLARAADPAALLFYNDYSLEFSGAKQDAAYAMIQDFKARGVPIDGIGFQSHFQVNADGTGVPSQSSLVALFTKFAALGVKIHLTELDIRVRTSATAAELTAQTQGYTDVVSACRSVPACEAVIVWGLDDGDSWIPNSFSGYGSATLFDASLSKKATYTAFKNAL